MFLCRSVPAPFFELLLSYKLHLYAQTLCLPTQIYNYCFMTFIITWFNHTHKISVMPLTFMCIIPFLVFLFLFISCTWTLAFNEIFSVYIYDELHICIYMHVSEHIFILMWLKDTHIFFTYP